MLGLAGILMIVTVLLYVISFVAGIWLIVVAFKRSVLWGLLTMLVPFAAIAFTIKNWQEARKPFLLGIGSGIAAFVCFLMGAGFAASSVTPELAQQMRAEAEKQSAAERSMSTSQSATTAPAQPRAATMTEPSMPVDALARSGNHASDSSATSALSVLDSMPQPGDSAPESSAAAMMPTTSASSRTSTAKPVYDADAVTRDGFAPVALSDAGQIIGRRVKLVTTSGQVHKGEMLRADAKSVSIERWMHGGSAVLDFSKAEIQSLHVQVN